MSGDEKILNEILDLQKTEKLDFILSISNQNYSLNDVEITQSSIPVNRPTKRGGVYFTDTSAFKIKARIIDLSVAPLLSKSMLGPSPDFEDLQIFTSTKIDGTNKKIVFFVNLTNSMQSSSYIEINTMIKKIECC